MAEGPPAATSIRGVDALARGEALGRYIVIERLGAGSMGVVYAAYDPELDRKVAVKLLRPSDGDASESRRQARFVREAKTIAKVTHPNVVGIFDVGVDDGRAFLAMEYLVGRTLREWVAAEKRSVREVLKMFIEVGKGLAAAHAAGLVHRDFKPDNVLLDATGTPKVADFGLARLSGGGSSDAIDSEAVSSELGSSGAAPLTQTGALAGTPAYMAPEQFRGKQTDGRTDQFAFCVALYEALYGHRPFKGETVFDLAESVMRERVQAPPKNTNVPGWLRRSLLRGLRADPAQRYAKIEDLLSALQADPVARVRRAVVVLVVSVTVAGTLAGLYRRSERRRVEFEGRVAGKLTEGRQALAEAEAIKQRLAEERRRAFAAFDEARREDGEVIWAGARADASTLEAKFKRAQAVLEAAMTLDQSNEQARVALGNALFERALLAEMEFRSADVGRHLEQMERLDRDGGLMERWTRPGSVAIRTTPQGARVVVEKYEVAPDDSRGQLLTVRVGEPVVTPAGAFTLRPGSYRLTITKDGFVETRYPFVVHRGEALSFDLPLVPARDVQADFVYVPEGRFLYGDIDEDWRVAYLNAGPIRERTTGSFFIKAHETTFGEWLEYLRDLPAAKRRLRTPSSVAVQGTAAVTGSLETGWSLELNISGHQRLTARQGSPFVFPNRRTRSSQDWFRMPVAAVSQSDMQAYLDWLSLTGRVPGARFCSEVEWERAARGSDGRAYPGSQVRLHADDADFDETYGRVRGAFGPDEVGAHPRSDSPFGIADMAGNVWEVVKASDDPTGFVARGGSYYQNAITARTTNREAIDLETRSFLLGLRICFAKK